MHRILRTDPYGGARRYRPAKGTGKGVTSMVFQKLLHVASTRDGWERERERDWWEGENEIGKQGHVTRNGISR